MKELNPILKDQTELHANAEQKQEAVKYNSSMKLKPGQKLWEIPVDIDDPNTITPVDITPHKTVCSWSKAANPNKKAFDPNNPNVDVPVMMKKNHFYCAAINPKNAIKKFIRFKLYKLRHDIQASQKD
jgi:hypothetical protein